MSGADLFVKNLAQFGKNRWNNAMQNPMAFKDQALSIASLVLVVSRVLVANFSALRARGTADGPYRYRESIRTDIREIAGWTFSFAVLRQVQKLIERKLNAAMNVKTFKDPNVTSIRNDVSALFSNKPIRESMPQLGFIEKSTEHIRTPRFLEKVWKTNWAQNQFKKNERDFALFVNKNLPMAAASIPSIFLAGYVLEGFARDHCNQVVDSISKMFHGASGKNQPAAAAPNPPQFGSLAGRRPHSPAAPSVPPPAATARPKPHSARAYARRPQPQPALFSGFYS